MSIHPRFSNGCTAQASLAGVDADVAGTYVDGPSRGRAGFYRDYFKYTFDLTVTFVLAWMIVPIVAVLAFLTMMDGHSPFYTQNRVGRGGRVFRMWKLRSMVHDADARLEAYLEANPAARIEWEHSQKLKNDPRITRIGRLMRKTSMDELPQLWNVVTGDMSLVGPRPMMTNQRDIYPGRSYYALRPGITGFWQISDRNECTFRDRALYDTAYERSLSLKTDLTVLVRTVKVVLRGTGY
ncbi:Undecaprenyl phosphate N,N'-diacetylbacillosamine 1-phosphate transferase [Jannaschia seosinensis]|uniref:Undecaprenyl phosphate N,N'-diacetylbacillosamine 1-phosphate transferase n=2 Tax=Jannaschia seosinensis TaxID=313367 RepID=A0A0M7BHN2_9RHOB|nr:Undecaprenyl phosphate N,N'-diacetylbacillosamine 1-phosphate transferase [Jannaschia seosinensis]